MITGIVQTLAKTAWLSHSPEHPEYHGWLVFFGKGRKGGDIRYTVDSVEQSINQINNQEYPLLPARVREQERRARGSPAKKVNQRRKKRQ